MVKKKTGQKKKRVRIKSGKQNIQKTDIVKAVVGLFVLILLVFAAGFFANRSTIHKQPPQLAKKTAPHKQHPKQSQIKKKAVINRPTDKTPKFEIYPKEEIHSAKSIIKPIAPRQKKMAKVAIIIDDIGYDDVIAEKFIKLDSALTISVLPYSPFQQKIIETARKNGIETMLHLPMEPVEYPMVNPGPGVLLTSMTPDQLIHCLNEDIDTMSRDTILFIKGVNNHMGSKMTADSTKMNQIFSILKKRGLFFIDSRTTSKTLCKSSAHLLQVPFAERNVFIDHIQDPDFIRNQINRLINIAIKQGRAIGIAHPHTETYDELKKMLPDLKKKVQIVPASELVRII